MSFRQLTQFSFLTVGFAVYVYQLIQDVPIDVRHLSPDCLSSAIESEEICDVTVRNRRLLLRNDSFSWEILRAKFETFFTEKSLLRFLSQQIQCLHIINEAFLVKRFVVCACFMVIAIAIIEFGVVRRMGNLIKSYRNLKRLEAEESVEWMRCVKDYTAEKITVLAFCVVRSQARPVHKHYIDFGEYVRDCLSLRTHSTDVTLFACWYCLLAICHVSTNSIFHRYIKTIQFLERPLMTRLRGQTVFIVLFLTMTSFVGLSGILVGASFVSYGFIHPDYASILFLESFRAFVRTLYVLDRVAMSVSTSAMNGIEVQRSLTDEHVSTIISNGFQLQEGRWNARSTYALLTLLVTFALNIYYAYTGLYVNRRILAFTFLLTANQQINSIANLKKYDPKILL